MENKASKKKIFLAASALLVVILAVLAIYLWQKPGSSEGEKEIVLLVTYRDGSSKTDTYQTDLEYLGELLQEKERVTGEQGAYGIFIEAVDGEAVDASKQEWWCITKNGETLLTSADQTPLEDGAQYELTLTSGY
ncbi:DUF4430 domain-containing protein [Hominifimenecus sp. rT4P-3]|uniref:DUF4430 domain-containing protein n=1 Tax=Hominifimenecus sp. rT4P-3 TaxID=3242979 RepID=UPI003DA3E614